jgi:predicted nuclease with TOPRIM domain
MLENRINRMTNQTIDPRYFDLQNTVKELREIDMKLTRDKKYMQSELEHVQKLTHNCNTEISQSRRDKVILEDDLQQCNMNCHRYGK